MGTVKEKESIEWGLSNLIFKSRDKHRDRDKALGFLLRLRYGGLRSLVNGFSQNNLRGIQEVRQNLTYYTMMCETHGVPASTGHILRCSRMKEHSELIVEKKILRKITNDWDTLIIWKDYEETSELVDRNIIIVKNKKKEKTLLDYWSTGEKDPLEGALPEEAKGKRKESEDFMRKKKIKKGKNGYYEKCFITEAMVKELLRVNVPRSKLKECVKEIVRARVESMMVAYKAFWDGHHDKVKALGENSEILRRYYSGTTIT